MDVNILTPKDLFAKDVHYIIPEFQRPFVWSQDKQWEPLWMNVRDATENYIEKLKELKDENQAKRQTIPHFLGAIVIQKIDGSVKEADKRNVIDGQQRMTTLQLLLDAVQLVCENSEHTYMKKPAKILSKFVTNDKDLFEGKYALKLWPTEMDQFAFKHAMHNELPVDDFKESLIVQAHEFFKSQVKEWLGDTPEQRIDSLVECITTMLQIVVIDLSEKDDQNIIFETLNARGTPLAQSDLIKNFVISKSQNSKEHWGVLNDKWYREEIRQGRSFRQRLDILFNYWLAMRMGTDVSQFKVFDTFREYVNKQYENKRDISDVMCKIRKDFENYRIYEQTDGNHYGLGTFFHHMSAIGVGVITPVLFLLLSDTVKSHIGSFNALESFLIRRMICRDTTRRYGKLVLELCGKLQDNLENADSITVDFLRTQTADANKWPTDKDVENKLLTTPLNNLLTKGRLRLILEGIERQLRCLPKTEDYELPKKLTVEHIMPVGWRTGDWPLLDGVTEEERDVIIHTIGNLTLVTQPLNSSMSNSSWESKHKALQDHSILLLNRKWLDKKSWNENDIKERSHCLAREISKRWPHPDNENKTQENQPTCN